jgi:uncharacterized protein (TIGR02646 family)
MITVQKRSAPPILSTLGGPATLADQQAYDVNKAGYDSGSPVFKIVSSIYGGPSVKSVLRRSQSDKCCYCEKVQKDEFGEVEHYRPKNGYYRFIGDSMQRPGYFWLGYSWDNLYFVCKTCNIHKSCKFYLSVEADRAVYYTDNTTIEQPLILDPGGLENPRDHIKFHNEIAKGETSAGKATIAACKLNRSSLIESRRRAARDLKFFIDYIKTNPSTDPLVKKVKGILKGKIHRSTEFSAMISDYLDQANISLN